MTTHANTTNSEPFLDYVEDSEPERKRIRLRDDQTKKRRTHRAWEQHQPQNILSVHDPPTLSPTPTHHHSVDGDNICPEDLSDVATEARPDPVESAVVDVIDVSTPSCSKMPSEVTPGINRLQASLASSPQLILSNDAIDTQEEPSEPNLTTRLGHLAYNQVRRASNDLSGTSEAERRRSAPKSQVGRHNVETLNGKSLPGSDATKLDVGPLLRCVSCDARWTVQKGVARKLSHITTCARKNGINRDTLQRLVEREPFKMRHAKTKHKKTTPSSDSGGAAHVSQTYLECVVAEAQQRRKQRRTDTAGTLQPVSQTRAAILDRAKALLGVREVEVASCDAAEPECTQSFGRSRLATGHGQGENVDPAVAQLSEEYALTSRLALLRSLAGSGLT